jgi:hypothetical protein
MPMLLGIVLLCPGVAHADEADKRIAALFDRPAAIRTAGGTTDAEAGQQIRCTYYKDFMVRETGTDTPGPGPAAIIPLGGGVRPACDRTQGAGELPLKTDDYSLLGRKGNFLLFWATDPNGAVPFIVLDAGTGVAIYSDAMIEGSLWAVRLDRGGLHLRFTRGVNGTCSLLKDAATCWDKITGDAAIPAEIAQSPPVTCEAAYHRSTTPPDDPSIVFYDVDVTLSAAGKAEAKPRGAVGCLPMP